MKLKGKLIVGVAFFFLLLLLVAGAALYFNFQLKSDTEAIIQDNYETLQYCHTMQQLLEADSAAFSMDAFEAQVKKQENNITEALEGEATQSLSQHLKQFDSITYDSLKKYLLNDIQKILELNMDAINKKNTIAIATAQRASDWITMLCVLILLIGITFVVNFPSIIVQPIHRLQEGIAEIINKNFKHRVFVKGNDELAQLGKAFNSMAARLQDYESSNLSQLMFEKARAEAVVNSLQDASIGIDTKGMILFVNHEALSLLGQKNNAWVGRAVQDVLPTNDLLKYVMTDDSAAPFKVVVSGREQYFIKEKIAIEKEKQLLATLYTLRNITNFQEKDTAKTNFIATISHELKTPISNIKFSLDLLQNPGTGTLNEEQNDLLNSVREDAFRLLKITGELLNMSQLESGAVQMALAPCVPAQISAMAINNARVPAQQKHTEMIERVPPGLPSVLADLDKTSWVLTNLITNAIRYSPEHSPVIIEAQVVGSFLQFSVKDKGVGIEPQFLDKIFNRYYRVANDKKDGSGLGLSICKEFIEAQGGKIMVESKQGEGSIFSFTLPMEAAKFQ